MSYTFTYLALVLYLIFPHCLSTGSIFTKGNITVYPSFPTVDLSITVQVSNLESCDYTSTCNMSMTVAFTNWVSSFMIDQSVV